MGIIRSLLPQSPLIGNDRTVDIRKVVNGIFYLNRTGCQWRMLPKEYEYWNTTLGYYNRWRKDGAWDLIHETLRNVVRLKSGRQSSPSAAVIDSQRVKTTERKKVRGYGAGKTVTGRKRHVLVDTLGLMLMIVVHAANIQDRDGAKLVLEKTRGKFPRLKLIWADGGYAGKLIPWVWQQCQWGLEIIKRGPARKGFYVLPRRWGVERTFAWLHAVPST